MDPHVEREREVIHEHHDVVERDSGTGAGMILGILLAIVLAAALIWFVLGSNLFGTAGGGTISPSSPSIQQPANPGQQPANPGGSSGGTQQGGGSSTGTGDASSGGATSGGGSVSGSGNVGGTSGSGSVSGGGSVNTTP